MSENENNSKPRPDDQREALLSDGQMREGIYVMGTIDDPSSLTPESPALPFEQPSTPEGVPSANAPKGPESTSPSN